MFKRFVGGLTAAVLLAGVAQAQVASDPAADRMRGHMSFLADDLLEGRNTGTRGFDLAALYVSSQFQGLGLTPAGDAGNTSWFQPVAFDQTTVLGGGMRWKPTVGAATSWDQGRDIIMIPAPASSRESITAPLVFVGYGIDAPAEGFDDYAGLDVSGKIVIAIIGVPPGTDPAVAERVDNKVSDAFSRGAVGLIQIFSLDLALQYEWSMVVQQFAQPQMDLAREDSSNPLAGRILALMDTPAASVLFAGAPQPLDQILAEADTPGGKPKGFALSGEATLSSETVVSRVTSHNVVGLLPGSDPVLKDEVVVVVAHLDHEGISPDETLPDRIYNGAMDNAAGIAAMLEVARSLSQSPTRQRRTVLFLAVTGEEDGLLGSAYFADNPTVTKSSLVAAVNMDMPLLTYPFSDIVALGTENSTLGQIVTQVAASQGLPNSPDPLPEEGFFTRSDQYSFVQRGIPAIDISTGPAGVGAETLRVFLEDTYHKPGDDLDQGIDWNAAGRFATLGSAVVRAVADADQRPLWYEGDRYGDQFAPDAEKAPRP